MSRRASGGLALGHDAFLDIVANLVGILIILLAIFGAESSMAIRREQQQIAPETPDPQSVGRAERRAAAAVARAEAARRESDRIEESIAIFDAKIEATADARSSLLDLLAVAGDVWDEHRSQLDRQQNVAIERRKTAQRLKAELASVRASGDALSNADVPTASLQHLPTPMAKTVFNDEIHLRIRGGRVSVVPLDHLLELITRGMGDQFSRRQGASVDSVGPLGGYVAKYLFNHQVGLVRKGDRVRKASRVALMAVQIEPLDESIGRAVDGDVLIDGPVAVAMAGRDPATTTVTIWVYPDSFGEFQQLRRRLYDRGYAAAARPLPMDRQITASPSGSRSRAQ